MRPSQRSKQVCFSRLEPRGRLFPPLAIQRERFGQFKHLPLNPAEDRGIGAGVQNLGNPGPHLPHLRLLHPTRGQRRSTNANPAWLHRRRRLQQGGGLVGPASCPPPPPLPTAATHTP